MSGKSVSKFAGTSRRMVRTILTKPHAMTKDLVPLTPYWRGDTVPLGQGALDFAFLSIGFMEPDVLSLTRSVSQSPTGPPNATKKGDWVRKHDDALIFAAVLDGQGGARELRWEEFERRSADDGMLWLHFHLDEPRAREWLQHKSGLSPIICDALLTEETRPRAVVMQGGLLMMLRGVNLNPGAMPEDMVSVRVWADARRVITVRRRKLMGIQDLIDALSGGTGPSSSAELILQLAHYMTMRMAPVISQIHESLESIEEEVMTRRDAEIRAKLSDMRRRIIHLRRFIGPQRETLMQVSRERMEWFGIDDMLAMREVAFVITRHVEDLDVAREQAIVTHDELTAFVNERLGRTMYVLALVTTFFLPITFITGLLGMNIGGVPGVPPEEYPKAFAVVSGAMVLMVAVQVWVFRRLRLMG